MLALAGKDNEDKVSTKLIENVRKEIQNDNIESLKSQVEDLKTAMKEMIESKPIDESLIINESPKLETEKSSIVEIRSLKLKFKQTFKKLELSKIDFEKARYE